MWQNPLVTLYFKCIKDINVKKKEKSVWTLEENISEIGEYLCNLDLSSHGNKFINNKRAH